MAENSVGVQDIRRISMCIPSAQQPLLDSNQRMRESNSRALPLGEKAIF